MQYVIQVDESPDCPTMYAGPVDENDAEYLREAAAHLIRLTDAQYENGVAVLFSTAAKQSIIIDDDEMFVCIEWEPGMLVMKVSAELGLQWVALRSPIPDFGGRVPLPEDGDPEQYEEIENPQYNLIFTPWDAQFDSDDREENEFSPASADVVELVERLQARLNALGQPKSSLDSSTLDEWRTKCLENLRAWAGTGVRL